MVPKLIEKRTETEQKPNRSDIKLGFWEIIE